MDVLNDNNTNDRPNKTNLWGLLTYLLVFMSFAFYSAGEPVFYDLSNTTLLLSLKLMQLVSVLIVFALPAFLFAQFFTNEKASFLKLNFRVKPITLLLSGLLFIVALPLINGLAILNEVIPLPEFLSSMEAWMKTAEENAKVLTEAFLQMNGIGDLLINMLVVAFAAAFTEELFFRGALQTTLQKVTKNKHLAIWIAAILFSAMHGQFFGFIPRAVLGAVLGYLYLWSGSLWVPIFGHFINNGFAVLMSYYIQQGVVSKEIENMDGTATDYILMVVSIIISGGIMFLLKKLFNERILENKELI
jgi:membrane protease YdiL (CAAX protease family)